MNKKLLAVAVAGALAAPLAANAQTTLYGSGRINLETESSNTDTWEIADATSRVGVKGKHDLGGGLYSIYKMEFGIDLDDGNEGGGLGNGRPHYVGLKGGFGQVTFGRRFTPDWRYWTSPLDPFNNGVIAAGVFGARASDLIYYDSPKTGGFQLSAAAQAGGGADNEDLDTVYLAGAFGSGPFNVRIVSTTVENATNMDESGIQFDYTWGPGTVSVGVATEETGVAGVDRDHTVISAWHNITPNDRIMIGYDTTETDGSAVEPTDLQLEWQHNFSKNTRTWIAYIDRDDDVAATQEDAYLQIGMRVDF